MSKMNGMTKNELIDRVKELTDIYEGQIKNLRKLYALSNNPYRLANIIEDKDGTKIQIEKIKIHLGGVLNINDNYSLPQCVYIGLQFKADGKTFFKDNRVATIYQCNIKQQ